MRWDREPRAWSEECSWAVDGDNWKTGCLLTTEGLRPRTQELVLDCGHHGSRGLPLGKAEKHHTSVDCGSEEPPNLSEAQGRRASVPRGAPAPKLEEGQTRRLLVLATKASEMLSLKHVLCGAWAHTHLSLPPELIPEETPENSFLLEGDILKPVSE